MHSVANQLQWVTATEGHKTGLRDSNIGKSWSLTTSRVHG